MFHLMQLAHGTTDSDLESVFSLEDEQTPETILSIAYFDSDSEEQSPQSHEDSGDDESQLSEVPEVFQLKEIVVAPIVCLLKFFLTTDRLSPTIKFQIFVDHYDKPIPVIVYFDTSAACTVINPDILPSSQQEPCYQGFRAANCHSFAVTKISKPIYIHLFLGCVLRYKAFGTKLLAKDLLIGFDLIHKISNLRWSKEGLNYKSFRLHGHVKHYMLTRDHNKYEEN